MRDVYVKHNWFFGAFARRRRGDDVLWIVHSTRRTRSSQRSTGAAASALYRFCTQPPTQSELRQAKCARFQSTFSRSGVWVYAVFLTYLACATTPPVIHFNCVVVGDQRRRGRKRMLRYTPNAPI